MSQAEVTKNNSLVKAEAEPQSGIQYLLVALAGREYGVRLNTLQEVMRFNPETVAPIPNTPEWLEGIISLRGTIISVVNLRTFLGYSRYDTGPVGQNLVFDLGFRLGGPIPRLLVVYSGELQISLLVDDILGVSFVNPEAVKPLKNRHGQPTGQSKDLAAPYLEGIYDDPLNGKTIALLNARKLITSPQMLQPFEPLET
ncbi:MAG: chemotaxis protein CheW [Chloroflexota bacterium]|nr:chemotaxis protein CheW [Chloroflexota bacterium]